MNCQEQKTTRTLLIGIWSHLSRRRQLQLVLLLIVMFASGLAELVSLGSVFPFLAALSEPEMMWGQAFVQKLAGWAGLTSASELLLPTAAAFAFAAVLAAFIRLTNLWLNGQLAAAIGSDLSCEAYRRTLYQDYAVHVKQNSSSTITTIVSEVSRVVGALNQLLLVITSLVVAVFILTGLILIDAQVAFAAAALFGFTYFFIAIFVRRELHVNSQKITEFSTLKLKALQEGIGAIRDILLDSIQLTYHRIYRQSELPLRRLQAKNAFVASFPRYAIEALSMVAIALLGAMLVLRRGGGAAAIPLLGSIALGAQRLLPALQQTYNGWVVVKSSNSAIKTVLEMLDQPLPPQLSRIEPLALRDCVNFKGVHFCYGPEHPEVLRGLNLEIRCGESIGLIGSTGSGKSTMIDLLMGLLEPTKGKILVDGEDLHDPECPERLLAWRSSIAHVPQTIYLADSSIAENIAFGVPIDQIDFERVKRAAQQAQISAFIESTSESYATFVGERGVRLSGGQRQRIGIARAIYKQANVLILDEATSALDSSTEWAVMDAVEALSKQLTIVMIAHRLSTVQRCDRVIRLAEGLVYADGIPSVVSKEA